MDNLNNTRKRESLEHDFWQREKAIELYTHYIPIYLVDSVIQPSNNWARTTSCISLS